MRGAFLHTVVYVAVNGMLIAVWVLFGKGSADDAAQGLGSLDRAKELGFWPLSVMVLWAPAVLINWGAAIGSARRKRRKRQRKAERAELRQARAAARQAGAPVRPGAPHDTATTKQWLAVMFTDLTNSTPLTERIGDAAWAAALKSHREFVRDRIDRHGGREVGTQGDGFLIRFADPDAAVACAVDLQRASARRRTRAPETAPLRIGIHAGEVVHDGADDDLVGRVVNIAARVTDVADPHEILVTEAVVDHLAAPARITDRGLHQLKGIERPRHLLAVVWADAPAVVDLDARVAEPG